MNTIQLTAENFIRALQGEEVVDSLDQKHCFLKQNSVQIDNITFGDRYTEISIDNTLEFNYPIRLNRIRCRALYINGASFSSSLILSNVGVEELKIENVSLDEFAIGGKTTHLFLSKNSFNKSCKIQDSDCYSIHVEGGKYANFHMSGVNVPAEGVWIKNGHFTGDFNIHSSTITSGLTIKSNVFEGKFIANLTFVEVNMIDNELKRQSSIIGGEGTGYIIKNTTCHELLSIKGPFLFLNIKDSQIAHFDINGGEYKYVRYDNTTVESEGGISISAENDDNATLIESLTVSSGTFECDLTIDTKFVNSFSITGGEFKKPVKVVGKNAMKSCIIRGGRFYDELYFSKVTINQLVIDQQVHRLRMEESDFSMCRFTNEIGYPLNVSKCEFIELQFINLISSSGKVTIDNSKVSVLSFHQFANEGSFRVNDLTAVNKGRLQIIFVKSVLGNMVLSGVSFSSFRRIIVDNCRLNNVDLLINPFPTSDKVFTDEEGEQDTLKLAEIYKQLYFSAKNQGDRINEITYYAEYMDTYQKHLSQNEKGAAAIATLFTLWFNKYSTRYGTNWLQGVGITIVLSLLFFVLYCLLFPKVEVDIAHFSYKNLSFYAVKYIEFLNPVHKFDFMNGCLPSFGSAVIDLITRVLVGALIYQIIVAFRRLGKF